MLGATTPFSHLYTSVRSVPIAAAKSALDHPIFSLRRWILAPSLLAFMASTVARDFPRVKLDTAHAER